jgi:hypothetical protein
LRISKPVFIARNIGAELNIQYICSLLSRVFNKYESVVSGKLARTENKTEIIFSHLF